MKRALISLIAASSLALALGAGAASAHPPGSGWGRWGGGGAQPSATPVVAVAGTITGVDPSAGTFTANAFVPQGVRGDWARGRPHARPGTATAPATTPVTISTDGSTHFRVNGQSGTISGLAKGQRFVALFSGTPQDSLQTLVAGPALAVSAHTAPAPRQLYAFVGTVKSVDTTAGTLTVEVAESVPSGLVPAASNPATFTISTNTLVLGGSSGDGLLGGSLGDVNTGDVVAGGMIGTAGETLSQVESTPLQVLVDFPAATTTSSITSSARRQAKKRALTQALALFGSKSTKATGTSDRRARAGTSHARGRSGASHSRRRQGRK